MAFRVPTQPPQRQQPYSNAPQSSSLQVSVPSPQQDDDDSREWVLFSPSQAASSTARTHTTSTERTPRTAGLSRFSDFGSLGTATQSADGDEELNEDDHSEGILEDDGTELDSLDDGLHAFREPSTSNGPFSGNLHQSDPAFLPAHDGLGTFAASSQPVQEQIWRHEQYNPRRRGDIRPRRRSSVQRHLETVNEMQVRDPERDKWQRIEQWRLDQSRALLQEIEKETRRRRNSRASLASERLVARQNSSAASEGKSIPTLSQEARAGVADKGITEQSDDDTDNNESFWRRITRKVIRDIIGIDDSLLCVIFGEALVEDIEKQDDGEPAQKKPKQSSSDDNIPSLLDMDKEMKDVEATSDDWWQERLLARIARELGILMHQIYEHPGAFSTYLRSTEAISNEYAGIPLSSPTDSPPSSRPAPPSRTTSTNSTRNLSSVYSPQFAPTLQQDAATSNHAALWGIEEEPLYTSPTHRQVRASGNTPHSLSANAASEAARLEREREYWERELDIKMVFRYLRNRFGKTNTNTHNASSSSPRLRTSSTATSTVGISNQQDPSHRAAIIRQHHPLVAHAHAHANARARGNSNIIPPSSPVLHHRIRRSSSSCASQSTKFSVSTKRSMVVSGSSRHFWDIGGSVGSGSAIVPAVGGAGGMGMGSWGDV